MLLCYKTIRSGLVVFHVLLLMKMAYSLDDKLLKDFSLDVSCKGLQNQPGFGAELVRVCVIYKSDKKCSNDEEDTSKTDSSDESDDLFLAFIKLMGQGICQNKKATFFKFLNETEPFFESGPPSRILNEDDKVIGLASSKMIVPGPSQSEILNEDEDDDMRATMDRLRIGVAVGTILGFVFGVLITGVSLLLYTKKMNRHGNSRNTSQIDTQRKSQEIGERADDKYDHVNYTYCDVNDEICQRPTELSSKSQTSEISHKYHDCNLNTYNHLNESNNAIRREEYDHVRDACADTIPPSNGEYRMLEPANSNQEVGVLPIEKQTDDILSKPRNDNYFELENVKCQASEPDAYFVLEKDSK